jgi:hypothetical protein
MNYIPLGGLAAILVELEVVEFLVGMLMRDDDAPEEMVERKARLAVLRAELGLELDR